MSRPKVDGVLDNLYDYYGRPTYQGPDDILGVLVRTILSQNTNKKNTDRAFRRLLDRFDGDWERIGSAVTDEVVEAIKVGGLARQKAPRIQKILQQVREETGRYSLEFLQDEPTEAAREYLLEFKGVGPKTAAFTLMYAADFPVFPMDTHIIRICKRLGWIGESTSDEKAHETMEPKIPDGEYYAAHVVMVRHGRELCHARNPDCGECPLLDDCPTAGAREDY